MNFDNLINEPHAELDLLRLVAEKIQATFHEQNERSYYIKLQKVDENHSKIIWVKVFDDIEDYKDFHYSFEFSMAAIVAFRKGDYYKVSVGGFMSITFTQVYPDRIENSKWIFSAGKDPESCRVPPREVIEAGFGDLTSQFRKKAKKVS